MKKYVVAASLLTAAIALPVIAQNLPTEAPGKPDVSRVTAGTYDVDHWHTQVAFAVNHMGFNTYHGLFGEITGTLTLDPKKPAASKVSIDIPLSGLVTTAAALNEHLAKPEFFDIAKFPSAHFEATNIVVKGTHATINGNLTIKGITKPVVLAAHFVGAGKGPMDGKDNVGFEATTTVKRSDFGISYGIPLVSDAVELQITAAFEKKAG